MKELSLRRYGLAILWLISIPVYIVGGFDDQYWAQAWLGRTLPYSYSGVLINIVLSGVATIALYLIIRPWSFRHSISRLLISLIIFVTAFFVNTMVIADPPGFQKAENLWLSIVIVSLLMVLILNMGGSRAHDKQ